ncbi:MAG TPA: molybdopterin dinucleotide-binding protein [Eggerthellaceae bacterium]|nr:molybdopterin dinucleotide-binding protein [Eggerthellaceae bacterium]
MTGHYCDLKNADVLLSCGSNNLENHPVSSKWVQRALDAGATWIVVDPRFTRTASQADIYCPIRSGTDIAFYGGMINYIIENDLWQHEYVRNYTNATYLIKDSYSFDVETGLFSGWDPEKKKYDTSSWGYVVNGETAWDTSEGGTYAWANSELHPTVPAFTPKTVKDIARDETMTDPNCVWQIMKNHYSRYTIEAVCEICGMDAETLELVYSTYAATGAPEKSGTIMYALGQTQHHYGSQNTRIMTLIQLLLGNVGVAGGGVNALRGEPNVQGATDMAMLVYDFPGYLKWPSADNTPNLRTWLETQPNAAGYYTNKPKFFVSGLKEWFGRNATVDNDYGYDWLPKIPKNGDIYTTIGTFELMDQGIMKGYFAWGQNPVVSDPNAKFNRNAMCNLDWLVVADWVYTATAEFWNAPDMIDRQKDIKTEVYFLPAALIYEKSGTILNSGRWMQWRQKAVDPVDQAKPDYEICDLLWCGIRDLYQAEPETGDDRATIIRSVKWDYYVDGKIDPRPVAWALNGYVIDDDTYLGAGAPRLLSSFTGLAADGTTANAIWIYGGFYNNNYDPYDPSVQPVARRHFTIVDPETGAASSNGIPAPVTDEDRKDPQGLGLYPNWAFSWPANRRIIYNRASADPQGRPWNPDRVLVEWDEARSEWIRNDVPDFGFSTTAADGTVTHNPPDRCPAFFMKDELHANFVTTGMKDAPLPEHYEPFETPLDENPMNGSLNSPMIKFAENDSVKKGDNKKYPIVCTSYSITEHWQTGAQTRMCPVLDEIQPEQFIEMSEELAKEKGISNGDDVIVFNNRSEVPFKALVTKRVRPLTVQGRTVHLMGMIHHWDWTNRYSTNAVANELTPNVGDPNSYIPEYKAFLVDVRKA